jgi:hypothetical protein
MRQIDYPHYHEYSPDVLLAPDRRDFNFKLLASSCVTAQLFYKYQSYMRPNLHFDLQCTCPSLDAT